MANKKLDEKEVTASVNEIETVNETAVPENSTEDKSINQSDDRPVNQAVVVSFDPVENTDKSIKKITKLDNGIVIIDY